MRERACGRSPTLAGIPILASSGSTNHETEAKCLEAGADAFLAKPIDLDEFLAETGRLLSLTWTY